MESVSAVKMRKSQERAFVSRPYVHSAMRILARLAESRDGINHPLAQKRENGRQLLVLVTSDKGLAGSVNSAVLKRAEENFANNPETDVIAFGRKAVEFAKRQGKEVLAEYTNVSDDVQVFDVYEAADLIVSKFKDTTYKNVAVIYQNFISTFEQVPVKRHVLPLDPADVYDVMRGIKPKVGKFSDDRLAQEAEIDYLIEPSSEEVLSTLIPQLVQVLIFHALMESKASEHSARMVAMKNATDKSKEVIKALTIEYNKARQAAITAEVSEITAGVEAMK